MLHIPVKVLDFLHTRALLSQLALLVQDQLLQKDGLSIYPVLDIKKRGILGVSPLGKLTLCEVETVYYLIMMD